jgi:spoIIIJ-associated protein
MKNIQKIYKVIENFFDRLGYDSRALLKEERSDDGLWVNVEVADPSLLIGRNGQNLADIQHLLRLLVNKELNEFTYLTVDINDYKSSQIEEAISQAKDAMAKVLENQEQIVLEPMNSFKRKIIHMEIKENPNLNSRSIGEEPSRRVMVELKE